ncbi:MAG: hypothetical protein H6581_30810 [Bacteroidia bacterium]|nr:hypothetical protein [Bacteroidia bacterium]
MKNKFGLIVFALIALLAFNSCEEDDDMLNPTIQFKTGTGYTANDATLAGGTAVKIGIDAEKEEEKDPLIAFNISRSVNGGADSTVYNQSLTGTDQDMFEYDYNLTLGTTSGQTEKYTFTVTNKDGLQGQVGLTLTVQ